MGIKFPYNANFGFNANVNDHNKRTVLMYNTWACALSLVGLILDSSSKTCLLHARTGTLDVIFNLSCISHVFALWQVDNGCIEHLLPSLYKDDWDVLIAHFLGVVSWKFIPKDIFGKAHEYSLVIFGHVRLFLVLPPSPPLRICSRLLKARCIWLAVPWLWKLRVQWPIR